MQTRNVLTVAVTFTVLALSAPYASAFEPVGKVECLAASDPGGGWDFTCRSVGSTLEDLDLVPRNVQTINMAGAGGGVGFAHVVSKRAGDDQLLIAASTATTSRLAQDQFPGMNAEMVNWIGALGADYGVIAVRADSELDTLNELMDALKEDPRSVKFAGGSPKGGWDHLKLLIAAQAGGIEDLPRIAYLSYNNGGEAMTQVVGGHVDAFSGDISEARGFMASGDLRVLAVLADERLPGDLSHIPTAREQGIDAVAPNWRGFYMPGGISDDARQYWVDAMDTIYHSEQWQSVMQNNGLMPFHMSGEEFEAFVMQQIVDIRQLSRDIGLIQ